MNTEPVIRRSIEREENATDSLATSNALRDNGEILPTGDEGKRRAPKIAWNIAANFIGTAWAGLMGPALTPIYIKFLGVEAYGLVGIFTTLHAAFTLLDLGLSTTTNRELARLSIHEGRPAEARDLVRTTELIYWTIAGIIAVIVVALAPFLTRNWIQSQRLSTETVQQALLIMGVILAFQFPFALYSGGLIGLQQQVLLNAITMSAATVRGIGTVLLLWRVSPTIQTFFLSQLIATILQTGATAFFLWKKLPAAATRPRFQRMLILRLWRFAAGMIGISFFSFLLLQADKVVLSRLLTLEQFGYYSLATVVSLSLLVVITPIFTAVFPRFSQLVAEGNQETIRSLYHQTCQLVSVTLLPIAVVLVLFAPEILQIWTGNAIIVQNTHLLVSLLVIGTALNGIVNVPYALQLASGWTKLALYQNIVAVILLIPLMAWSTHRYGAIGAAVIWIMVNSGYVLIGIQVMHTRILPGEKATWYIYDVGLPLVGALGIALLGRAIFPTHASFPVTLGGLALVSLSTLVATSILTPLTRERLRKNLSPYRYMKERHNN